jgi:hypothetical protein
MLRLLIWVVNKKSVGSGKFFGQLLRRRSRTSNAGGQQKKHQPYGVWLMLGALRFQNAMRRSI